MRLVLTHASIVELDDTWSSTPDLVKDIRLILIQEGYGLWTIDRRTDLFRPNDLIFLKPGQLRHARMAPKQPVRYLAVRFSLSDPEDPLPPWLLLPSIFRLTPKVRQEVETIVQRIKTESLEKGLHYLEVIDSLARQLFVTLARSRRQCARVFAFEGSDNKRYPEIERVIHYIHDHLAEQLDVSRLAGIAGMSQSRFRRLFRSLTGLSPRQYLIRTRVWHAQELLKGGDFYVYEVARAVGYEDNLYFSRLFHKIVGLSPTDYRSRRVHP